MSNAKETPVEFTNKRGLAYIEVAALRDEISRWIADGFSATSIYKLLVSKKRISTSYTYRTFLRAVHRMIPNARKLVNSHVRKSAHSSHEELKQNFGQHDTNKRVFTPATGNFVKSDLED